MAELTEAQKKLGKDDGRAGHSTADAQHKKSHLVAYKGGKCLDCGNVYPNCCYHFDHRDPTIKSFTISQKYGRPLSELMVEADKCDLVCANCHAIRTAGNPEIAKKLSEGHKGRKKSDETRRRMSIAKAGNQAFSGHRHTPEARAKMSEARRARCKN